MGKLTSGEALGATARLLLEYAPDLDGDQHGEIMMMVASYGDARERDERRIKLGQFVNDIITGPQAEE